MFHRRGGGALGDGRQALVFGGVDAVGGADDVEGVVGLLGQSGGFSPLQRKEGSLKSSEAKHQTKTILPFELIKRK